MKVPYVYEIPEWNLYEGYETFEKAQAAFIRMKKECRQAELERINVFMNRVTKLNKRIAQAKALTKPEETKETNEPR